VALYGSWFAGLGNRGTNGDGVRRAAWLIAADVALLIGLVAAATAEMSRFAVLIEQWLGWRAPAGRVAVVALALVGAAPFVAGLVQMTRHVAGLLALRAMPAPSAGRLDRAFAPRAAFVATLHLALLVVCALPVVAVLTAVAPGVATLGAVGLLVAGLLFAVWRSARVLYGHARAGAEVIVMALTQHDRTRGSDQDLALAMDRVSALLPGLGDPEPLRLSAGDPGVGRTLSDLNLRGATGANVVAILRVAGASVLSQTPTGHERLQQGDVLAIAGSPDAVQAAKRLLAAGT
jgi:CPA2 family monovalent cation:H+ antiporter-2